MDGDARIVSIPLNSGYMPTSRSNIQILKVRKSEEDLTQQVDLLNRPRFYRWAVLADEYKSLDNSHFDALNADVIVFADCDGLDRVCEVLAAIASSPQKLLVGIDVADFTSMIGASGGRRVIGEALFFDGMARNAPDSFFAACLPSRSGLLVQLVSSSGEATDSDLSQLATAALNCKGIKRMIYTQKEEANSTSLILIGFDQEESKGKSMKRARVFVWREQQLLILPQVEEILASCVTDDYSQDYTDNERNCVASAVRERFGVDYDVARTYLDTGMEPYGISAYIAKALLDRDPPDTTPPWSDPWERDD